MKILFLSRWYPYPITNGSKLRIFHLLKGLSAAHEVSLLCFSDPPVPAEPPRELKAVCAEVRAVEWREFRPKSWKSIAGFLGAAPRSLADTFSPVMASEIQRAISTTAFDLVICSEWVMSSYNRYFRGLPVLYEEIEVGLPYESFAGARTAPSRLRSGLTWFKYRQYLKQLMKGRQACTVVSERERQLVSQIVHDSRAVHVIPNCVELSEYAGMPAEKEAGSLIFTGSFRYAPNYEAAVWFLREVFPRVLAAVPGACLTITGDHASLPLPETRNVVLTGHVPDVRPYIARAAASLAPLLEGGGTRLKILEAMALGTPVVSTSKGAEGLDVAGGRHLLIADSAESFASEVISLLNNPELRRSLSSNAYQVVREKYDWAVVMPTFLDLVERAAKGGPVRIEKA